MALKFGFVLTNLTGGGAEKAVLKIGAGLAQRHHDVHIVLLEHVVEHAVPQGVSVHTVTRPGVRLRKGAVGKWLAAWRLRELVRRLNRERPFDLIVSTLPFADEVTVRADLPRHWCRIANTLSVEVDRLRQSGPAKAKRRLARYRRIYASRPLIAVSEGVAQDLRELIGLARAPIERIYNPFDLAAIRARALEPATLPSAPYVVHVGRFASQKRHDLLLDAWMRLNAPHQLVLLTAPDSRLTAMIAARGLGQRVTVAGFQPNPYPWIAGADLLVLCSDHEGLPNVIIEALAVGTPVVSTDCPSGPREILGGALPQCLVPVGDALALAHGISAALVDPPDVTGVDLARFDSQTVSVAYERLATAA
jgi:glycosyltransferase involved in cell wall biosynthesis